MPPPSSSTIASQPSSISPAAKLRLDLYTPRNIDDLSENDETPPLVVSVLASLLQRTISRNVATNTTATTLRNSPFHSRSVLDLSILSFLHRIYRHARPSPSIFVVAYVYLDRLRRSLPLHPSNSQRVLLTAIMVASKFLQDVNYRNSHYAKIGGVTTEAMNEMEVELLFVIGFRLHVNVRVFESYCRHLEREVSLGGGYQIERTLLRCMCSLEDSNSTGDSREGKRLAPCQLAKLIL